jgi:hypothetical protein
MFSTSALKDRHSSNRIQKLNPDDLTRCTVRTYCNLRFFLLGHVHISKGSTSDTSCGFLAGAEAALIANATKIYSI